MPTRIKPTRTSSCPSLLKWPRADIRPEYARGVNWSPHQDTYTHTPKLYGCNECCRALFFLKIRLQTIAILDLAAIHPKLSPIFGRSDWAWSSKPTRLD